MFAECEVRAAPLIGKFHGAGQGGWPTIKYFNKETGAKGGRYPRVQQGRMCDELGDMKNMAAYIEAKSGATAAADAEL